MAKSKSGDCDRDGMERVWDTIVVVLFVLLLFTASHVLSFLQVGRTASLRGVPDHPMVENSEAWRDLGDALAVLSASSADLRILPNIDPEGHYNVGPVDQRQAILEPVENINARNAAAAAEADLEMWLAVAEVASLPRQIERDEANMMVTRPRVLYSTVADSGVAPSSLVPDDEAAGVPRPLPPQDLVLEAVAANAPAPEVVGIPARDLPPQIEVEVEAGAEAQVVFEVEVAMEDFPPSMLELITDVARLPQFAAASMIVPAGGLESNLEERMPVDQPETRDSSADFQGEPGNIQKGDVENLEVEEPHAKDIQ